MCNSNWMSKSSLLSSDPGILTIYWFSSSQMPVNNQRNSNPFKVTESDNLTSSCTGAKNQVWVMFQLNKPLCQWLCLSDAPAWMNWLKKQPAFSPLQHPLLYFPLLLTWFYYLHQPSKWYGEWGMQLRLLFVCPFTLYLVASGEYQQ